MTKNHHRADHKVNDCYEGFNVRIPYKGYQISLASDGGDTVVFKELEEVLFESVGTNGYAVKACINFIDGL